MISTKVQPKAAFYATRLNSTTFLVKEYDDIYSEHPHIYAKIAPSANTVLLVDTGCGGASNDSEIEVKSLRRFMETINVDSNDGKPLNPGGLMRYVVVLSHCHFDHIHVFRTTVELLGRYSNDSPILASSYSPAFLSPSKLPESSLCKYLDIETPSYTATLVPHLHPITSPGERQIPLHVSVLHTPGHTPDELALYDEQEMMLYVGDSLYEYEPIIFPAAGSIVTWFDSMDYLVDFVRQKNDKSAEKEALLSGQVLINSGHRTAVRPAIDVLLAAKAFVQDVIDGKEPVKSRTVVRGEVSVAYEQVGSRFSLRCPERLVLEARDSQAFLSVSARGSRGSLELPI
ncbi:Metallo-hydrolase/oxidoreductase [Hysterangium stoloniferum]|nr:Metallo-hydrolase/oxidoreductase [Hysterangium stoloniferum]